MQETPAEEEADPFAHLPFTVEIRSGLPASTASAIVFGRLPSEHSAGCGLTPKPAITRRLPETFTKLNK